MSGAPLLAILGPTASGKSSVAMHVAESPEGRARSVELISVDAMQVYRGMDIGTAKPTESERRSVRHHLVDLVEADESFTVARFQEEFRRAVADIEARHGAALMVGGTGLYVRAAVDDLDIPGQWPEVRSSLEHQVLDEGPAALHERLATLDPVAASRMEPTNVRRIVRALEVTIGGGRPFSSYGPGVDTYPPTPVRQFALQWPREVLARRIESRVGTMIDAGLVVDVEGLMARGLSPTARQALGYKEIVDHLAGRTTLEESVALIVRRTRQFAVRQERWFRRDPRIVWIPVEADPVQEAGPRLVAELETG
ncbi:MAG: tRNA (adenosine(37)-N6)-dimethylallyltransferase MiaA [Actinomycetota bacterium]